MPALHKNRVKMTVTGTPGTGTITLNAASSAHQSFAAAYGANATVDILITEGTAWEVARNCTYTHSGTTVTRGTLEASSTGSAVSFTSAATVEEILTAANGNLFTDFVGAWGALAEENAITGAATAVFGKLNVCSGTSADYTVTLPAASGNGGKYLGLRMDAALTKLVTIDGNASETIDGALTRIMWAYETAILLCDGSNWFKVGGRSIPMDCILNRTADQTGIASLTWTKILLTNKQAGTDFLWDSGNNRAKIVRPGRYQVSFSLYAGKTTTGLTNYLYLGAFKNAISNSLTYEAMCQSSPYPAGGFAIGAGSGEMNLVAGDVVNLSCYGPTVSGTYDVLVLGPVTMHVLEIPTW